MAVEHKISGELREKTGTAECRRIRNAGMVPANVYGHGKGPIAIKVTRSDLNSLIATGSRLFDIEYQGTTETVMFQQAQWDAFGIDLQHVDFLRVDATETVTVEVPIELKGTAPGIVAGGIFQQPLRRIEVECLAAAIPDSIPVRIGGLEIGSGIYVRDLEVGTGVTVKTPETALICQIVVPKGQDEEEDEGIDTAPVEPEVIGKKDDDAGGEG